MKLTSPHHHYSVEDEETVELYTYLHTPFVTSWHVKCELTLLYLHLRLSRLCYSRFVYSLKSNDLHHI